MADIKVKRTSGLPWWVLALLALLVVGLLWWAFVAFTDDDDLAGELARPAATGVVADTGVGEPAGQVAPGEAITELAPLLNAGDSGALAGREVRLNGVRVQSMVSDATFWVGDAEERVLVILDQQIPSPPPLVEGRVNVNAGQTVDVRGEVRRGSELPTDDTLDPAGRAALGGQALYIWANAVEVASPPSAVPEGPPGRTSN